MTACGEYLTLCSVPYKDGAQVSPVFPFYSAIRNPTQRPQSLKGRNPHLEGAMLFVNGKQIQGVIFDIDGTLVDTFPPFTSVFNKEISQFDLRPVSQQFLVQSLRKGANLADVLRRIFPLPTDESLIERCQREILQHFLKIEAGEVKPFPGINRLFGNLKEKGIKIGIATGRMSMPEKEWDRFKRLGLERLIDSIVTSREVASRKPAPDALVACAQRMNVPVEACLVVGDTEDDILATRKAGGIPVAILAEEDHLDLSESEQPEFIFKNLVELTLFLEEEERTETDSG